jgi:FMN-dependent NADH-azoreductase
MLKILRVEASARRNGSISRNLTGDILNQLSRREHVASLTTRDLADGVPLVSEAWIGANFTPADQRIAEQSASLSYSDELVDELLAADVILIGLPMYNFSVPASFKAWIDQVARAGRTFRYTENGPEGLLKGKRVIVSVSTGGTPLGSPMDFVSAYVRFALGFLGLENITFISADKVGQDADQALENNKLQISKLITILTGGKKIAA